MSGQPIQRFIETVHDEWAENDVHVDVGEHTLRLTAAALPSEGDEKKRKVVVIHEVEEIPAGISPQLSDPLARVKQGLAWLYKQKMGTAVLDVLKQLAVQINELERLSGLADGENGRSDHPQRDDGAKPAIMGSMQDKEELPSEAQGTERVEVSTEPQIDIAERLPGQPPGPEEQVLEELDLEKDSPPAREFQSGLLQKHLDTQPKEKDAVLEQFVEDVLGDKSSASDKDDALETLQEILDGEISAGGTEDQLAVGEDFFENIEKELSFDGSDEALGLVDTPSEEPVPSPPAEGSKIKDSNWPPRRPSEMKDFEEYK